jgi:hypothetical protein
MPKTKVYSVRLQSLLSISPKAYKAKGFDGSEAILPKSQVFGPDYDVTKSEAYWIAAWILEQKELQYSTKKAGWFNPETGKIEPDFTFANEDMEIIHHIPEKKEPVKIEADAALTRQPIQ